MPVCVWLPLDWETPPSQQWMLQRRSPQQAASLACSQRTEEISGGHSHILYDTLHRPPQLIDTSSSEIANDRTYIARRRLCCVRSLFPSSSWVVGKRCCMQTSISNRRIMLGGSYSAVDSITSLSTSYTQYNPWTIVWRS